LSADEILTVLIDIRANTQKAVDGLTRIRNESDKTAGVMGALQRAGSQAAGMLMRDMVRGATQSFGEIAKLGGQVDTLQASFD